jgi:phosphate transport system substrate-binding protein
MILLAAASRAEYSQEEASSLQKFVPTVIEGGEIRSWGNDAMGETMEAWQKAFRGYHPEVTFKETLYGSGTGMAGIITGTSELSLMGRPVNSNEVIGFEWVFRYKPLGVRVMNGGLKSDGKTPALAIFVSQSNPIRQVSLAQLSTALGCPAHDDAPPTWALVGAKGTWANRPIHAYLYDSETGTGSFLQQVVLNTRDRWNWDVVKEFKDRVRRDRTVYAAGQQIVDALKRDPNGIAISTIGHAKPWVRSLAVSVDGRPVEASEKSVTEESYPLTRGIYIYVNREPGKPLDAKVREFLRFVLSDEGQNLVRRQGDYLPLNATTRQTELKKME